MEEKYLSEVKESIMIRAMYSIVNARKEGRLSWDGTTITYKERGGKKHKLEIEGMPSLFLEITGTQGYVNMLIGDCYDDLKEIFVKVLNTPIKDLDAEKLEKESEEKLNILRQMAKEQEDKENKKCPESQE